MEQFLAKADRSLAAAEVLLRNGHPDFAASRAYYAAFYAASAALLGMGLKFATHRGLLGAVHQQLVKTGKLPTGAGEAIGSLFEARQTGDYESLPCPMPSEEGGEAIALARFFVSEVRSLIQKEDAK